MCVTPMTPLFWALLLAPCIAFSALPPGYEEELYCPAYMCLKHKQRPMGWYGSRVDFHTCCHEGTGQTKSPRAWGVKVDPRMKEMLLNNQWHKEWCMHRDGVCGMQRHFSGLYRMVNLLSRVDGLLHSI